MKFQVVYQDTPYAYTAPHGMIVEADSPVNAWIAAYVELTRRGNLVEAYENAYGNFLSKEDWAIIRAAGIAEDSTGRTHIRAIKTHDIKSPGKVISVD